MLPIVEEGTVILIGATTENPLYEINAALLSRVKLYVLKSLDEAAINTIIDRALLDTERGLGKYQISLDDKARQLIITHAKGDARIALNILETLVNSSDISRPLELTAADVAMVVDRPRLQYDKKRRPAL